MRGENMPKEERERVKKKKWDKPKLIILTKTKAEERVLGACKWDGGAYQALAGSCGGDSPVCVICQYAAMS